MTTGVASENTFTVFWGHETSKERGSKFLTIKLTLNFVYWVSKSTIQARIHNLDFIYKSVPYIGGLNKSQLDSMTAKEVVVETYFSK